MTFSFLLSSLLFFLVSVLEGVLDAQTGKTTIQFRSKFTFIPLESEPTINFLLLADWGKGGNSGDLTKLTYSYSSGRLLRSEGHEKDHGGDQHRNQDGIKVTYTYQAAIARSMSQYGESIKNKSSFVLALGTSTQSNFLYILNI